MYTPHSAETERRLNNVNNLGLIEQIDYDQGLARVRVGENLTDWIPFCSGRIGKIKLWAPPSVGEQVSIHSPSGELETAYITHSLPTDDNQNASKNPYTFEMHLPNGINLVINYANKSLQITGLDTGTADIATFNVRGNTLNFDYSQTNINGNLAVTGNAAITQGLTAQSVKETTRGVNLAFHVHAAKPPSKPADISGPAK